MFTSLQCPIADTLYAELLENFQRLLLRQGTGLLVHLVIAVPRVFLYSRGLDCIFAGSRRPCQSLGRSSYVLRHGLVPHRALTVIRLFHEGFRLQGA